MSEQGCREQRPGSYQGIASQVAEKVRFVSGHRFSDAERRVLSVAPLGAEVSALTFSSAQLILKPVRI
jgi:hypothetical protein